MRRRGIRRGRGKEVRLKKGVGAHNGRLVDSSLARIKVHPSILGPKLAAPLAALPPPLPPPMISRAPPAAQLSIASDCCLRLAFQWIRIGTWLWSPAILCSLAILRSRPPNRQ